MDRLGSIDCDSGLLEDFFVYPFGHGNMNCNMTAEDVADYLEHFAPWRAEGRV